MINKKDLELKLLLRESHIQQLNLKVEQLLQNNVKLRNKKIRIKQYVTNNYQYVDDRMKQYFDMILYIINEGDDKSE